ncbi:Lipase 1 [Verticillium dahliae VDG2]|nr:Lipase 1 [Verticillium dahliae VDG2]
MVYFTREGTANGEQIYMAVSNNNNPGSWTTVNNGQPVLSSTVGMKGVRDPSIIRSQDGKKYWIIATDLRVYPRGWDVGDDYTSNGSKGLVVWESSNLRTWSASQLRILHPAEKWLTGAGMDATVFRDPSSSIFYRFSKERTEQPRRASSRKHPERTLDRHS